MSNPISIEGFKLSPQQKYLWSLQKDSCTYSSQCAILITGDFNNDFLQFALQSIIDKYEIFRTVFHHNPGLKVPIQVVLDSQKLLWYKIELTNLSRREQATKINEIIQEERSKLLEEKQALPLHLCFLKLALEKHILIITLPAINADQITINNIFAEICYYYKACSQNQIKANSEDEVTQYIQFSEWQNQLIEDEDELDGKEYWQNFGVSANTTLKLPYEVKQSILSTKFEFKSLEYIINFDQVAEIKALVQKYNTSTSVFFLACWQILLWRIIGQANIIVSTAFDGRQYEELRRSFGLFAKYLPIKLHLESHLKFSEILQQVDAAVIEADEWQDYFTYETPFVPVAFDFIELPTKYSVNDVSFQISQQYICIDRFKLKLTYTHQDESLTLGLQYDVNCFVESNIKLIAEQFLTLLESILQHPEAEINQLNILSKRQRQQLLFEFNQTTTNYPQDLCIHKLFEAQVAQNPDKIAVVFEEEELTYCELNTRANQLAHYLQRLGVEPEVLVGICVERSLLAIIGILGILKAGGAYLPIDPNLPTSAIAFRLEDAQISILLAQQQRHDLFEDTVQVVCLDSDWQNIANEEKENPTSAVKPENLVYAIYTSGSTGKPKGVLIEHQQLLNYQYSIQDILNLPPGASFATVSSLSTDLGNTAIFPSLSSGGCLYIISHERSADPQALGDYLHRHPVDCLKIVPSHLRALMASDFSKQILPQKRLILGGEASSWNLIEQIQQINPECQILNHYGPTEATVGVLTYLVEKVPTVPESQTVPIGKAIANNRIYLLDAFGQPVPIGLPGELHIGGAGLARGYLHRPELTAQKFIEHPLIPGERLYKTGDLARYLPDGNIEFIGRIDQQVKIHGFRVELGEIEAALAKHPAISQSVVILREDEPGNKRLVAYLVPQYNLILTNSQLRGFLLELLPEYMVPSIFVQLKALPLTANGKVNRQMLLTFDTSKPDLAAAYVAPQNSIEEILAKIWATVLKVEQVGIYDNFFELGGDSILSIQIIAKAHQAGVHLSPKQLFVNQTIAELAMVASTGQVITAEQGTIVGPMPLTPIQHWFFEQHLPLPHHWNQAVLLETRQSLNPVLLQQALQKLLVHHDALRLRFVRTESGWQQINGDFEQVVPFTNLDLQQLSELEQTIAMAATATQLQQSLNLEQGDLLRVALFDTGVTKPNRLLIVIHHLAVDGVSWRILLEDLQTVYEQLTRGETIQLPRKTTSFKDWAERLEEYAHTAVIEQELDYWMTQIKKPFSHLPVDYANGANTVASECTVSVYLSAEETQALLQEVPATYRTQINDVLLTALIQSFTQWMTESKANLSDKPSLLVELEGHGREELFADVDLSRTVGWFTTHFPVLLELTADAAVEEILKAIKEQLRLIPQRGIGYGVLRYLSSHGEILNTFFQPEVKFNYLGQFNQVLSESSVWKLAVESSGIARSPQGLRGNLLDINAMVVADKLRLDWMYSQNIHDRTTVERLAENFIVALRSLITHCQSQDAGGYTPSDFPQMQLSSQELDELLTEL
ncbi:amino acid adenylation domain-containing protein [Nostoc sp.]|uniref:amino acid adenylation domain-containing protein n=1 Tax=Nostoc sp. TaxID=1180 RepID=UPI002FF7EF9D